jgi:hypothetical protein
MSHKPDAGPAGEGRDPFDLGPEGEVERDDPRLRRRIEQLVPDLVKRTFYAGLGALFTTEEGIRKLATDFQLPKDVATYLIHQAGSTKDELFRVFARELRGFLSNVNISGELQKLLTSLSFEIKTEIRFIPNDEAVSGVKPNLKNEVNVKRGGKKDHGHRDDE